MSEALEKGWSVIKDEAEGDCPECYGTGGLYDSHMNIDDECPACDGTGRSVIK
tara:strand:+ start:2647 stop:2805 length:159 start_codon:yes stop_codon:yes gene_type:complete